MIKNNKIFDKYHDLDAVKLQEVDFINLLDSSTLKEEIINRFKGINKEEQVISWLIEKKKFFEAEKNKMISEWDFEESHFSENIDSKILSDKHRWANTLDYNYNKRITWKQSIDNVQLDNIRENIKPILQFKHIKTAWYGNTVKERHKHFLGEWKKINMNNLHKKTICKTNTGNILEEIFKDTQDKRMSDLRGSLSQGNFFDMRNPNIIIPNLFLNRTTTRDIDKNDWENKKASIFNNEEKKSVNEVKGDKWYWNKRLSVLDIPSNPNNVKQDSQIRFIENYGNL